ncbi:hypothetical protein [Oceaniradius stylonematis]|uniref:hypothetical protein n=1 Tax=Oceaniradius stylonematis TaxID=2184161 RepID=UPI00273FDC3C|nr:hypothetical protein [Oceaniradius stylonematis]
MLQLDAKQIEVATAMIERVRSAGMPHEAEVFANAYWGWIRMAEAYQAAHPYVAKPEPGMTPISALTVVDYTFNHWADLIPGSPKLDDQAVLEDAARDALWHQREDRRMRIAAGDDI